MAVIGITFDTKTKAMACTMDGAAVANVQGAYLGKRYGAEAQYACELMLCDESGEGYEKYTRVVASALAPADWPDATVAGFKQAPPLPPDGEMVEDAAKLVEAAKAELAAFFKKS
jgi:hypothetical protein